MPESRVALRSAETDAHAQHVRTRELSPAFSLFLDIVRFAAALIVFLEHAKPMGLVGSLGLLDGLSGEAVIAFFVLSGFIIETTTRRERGWRHFALARAARIYSVFIPALVLGLVLKLTAALVLNRALLHELWTFDLAPWRLAASALFLGQAWTLQVPLPWNGAVWSLHFEVIYYVLFGFLAFAPRAWRLPAAMIVCALAGPKILLLMPCWWLGVWIAKHPHLGLPNRWTAWAVLLGAPALMVALNHAGMHEVVRGYLMDHVPAYWRLDLRIRHARLSPDCRRGDCRTRRAPHAICRECAFRAALARSH
ncbi:MAG: acyltransferase family protein, partial [Croceibacterium sp.]